MKVTLVTLGIGLSLAQTCLANGTPWLQEPGTTSVAISHVVQSADEFYLAREKSPLPSDLDQDTTWFSLSHGLTDSLALDLKTGYARSTFDAGDPVHDSGRTDTSIGISWRFLDEFVAGDHIPSVAVRAGVILQGNYETGFLNAVGDGGDGFEVSLIGGKYLTNWLAVSTELGYRNRSSGVPEEGFLKVGGFVSLLDGLSGSVSYTAVNATEGLQIGGQGFTPDRFPHVEEDNELVEVGIAYAVMPQASVGLNAGQIIDGRNTANSDIYAVTFGYSF